MIDIEVPRKVKCKQSPDIIKQASLQVTDESCFWMRAGGVRDLGMGRAQRNLRFAVLSSPPRLAGDGLACCLEIMAGRARRAQRL